MAAESPNSSDKKCNIRENTVKIVYNDKICVIPITNSNNLVKLDVEFKNATENWVVFYTKCGKNRNFVIQPQAVGLLAPGEREVLELIYRPNSNEIGSTFYFHVESSICFENSEDRKELKAQETWNGVPDTDKSLSHLPIKICDCDQSNVGTSNFLVTFKPGEKIRRQGIYERVGNLVDRLNREDLSTEALILLVAIFGAGVLLGCGGTHKCICTEVAQLCLSGDHFI